MTLTWSAFDAVRITSEVGNASANSSVISGCAVGIASTLAWIHTLLVLTFECCWTVTIDKAFIWLTVIVGISFVILQASADCSVNLWTADCIGATILVYAGILAFPVKACLSQLAL